jgi:predicted nucleotidyltransferase component of viral defense system
MLSLKNISAYYPKELHTFKDFLIREYLQFKILEIIFESSFASKLVFIGGTCLRIIHNNQRFSEDLDFDNISCSESDWVDLSNLIVAKLKLEGYDVEMKVLHKNAWHCYIRFPGILFEEGLSGYKEQKILIHLDVEPQEYQFTSEKRLINKFDVFTEISVAPLPLLMSHKIYAIMNRPRTKGRDFFDLAFMMGMGVNPEIAFLNQKININSIPILKEKILLQLSKLDMQEMSNDVSPFLFHEKESIKVKRFLDIFMEYWKDEIWNQM